MKILVVDDIGYNRILLEQTVGSCGYEVITASTGRQALAAIDHYKEVTIAVTDLFMPGMDGFELMKNGREARAANGGAPLLFILVTVSKEAAVVARAKAEGFFDVLVKPVQQARMADSLARATVAIEQGLHSQPDGAPSSPFRAGSIVTIVQSFIDAKTPDGAQEVLDEISEAEKMLKHWLKTQLQPAEARA